MSEVDKIKGCPFCGEKPLLRISRDKKTVKAFCDSNFCSANPKVYHKDVISVLHKWNYRSDAVHPIDNIKILGNRS